MTKDKIKCALYTRVSTRQQVEKDYNSLETQKERLESYVKSQENFSIYKVYNDAGCSAKNLDRPALQAMLRDIRENKIDCVLAYKIDRLTRSMKDFFKLLDVLDDHNVQFISTTQHFDSNTAHGRLFRTMLLGFAQFEREMTSDRTRDKLEQRAQKGLWNGGPVAYGYNFKDKKLVINNEEAEAVKFMFVYFVKDPSLARLRHELHHRGIYTRSGAPWVKTPISHILQNPIYCGKIRHKGKVYDGQHSAIIDESLFSEIQKLIPSRTWSKRRARRVYLLQGLVKCQDCGSSMTPNHTVKKRKDGSKNRIPYYRCTKTMKHGNKNCGIRSFNANELEDLVTGELKNISRNRPLIKLTIDDLNNRINDKTGPLHLELKKLNLKLNKIDSEIDRYIVSLGQGRLSIELLEKKIEERIEDKEMLKSRIAQLEQEIDQTSLRRFDAQLFKSNIELFASTFDSLSPQDKSEALQILMQKIEIHKEKIVLNVYELHEFSLGSENRHISGGIWESNPPPE